MGGLVSNFQIARGSTLPGLECVVTKDGRLNLYQEAVPQGCPQEHRDPNVLDLTSVWNVEFELYRAGRENKRVCTGGVASVKDKWGGVVEYLWAYNDTIEPGLYYGQFVITFLDNTRLKWPYQLESLSIEVMDGECAAPPVCQPRKKHDVVQIVQGIPKSFFVNLIYTDTCLPVNLLGVTEIVASFPQTSGPDPIQETLTGGAITIVSSAGGRLEINIPQGDSALMNAIGGPPFQNLQIAATYGSAQPETFILEGVLNIIPQVT